MLGWVYLSIVGAAAWLSSPMEQTPLSVEKEVHEQEADEMPQCMDTATFMKTYELKLDKEWKLDGKAAEWAPAMNGGPLKWGEEYRSMDLPDTDPHRPQDFQDNAQMVVSQDGKFMALSTNLVIRVYNMADKDLRAELVGHLGPVSTMVFSPSVPSSHSDAQYMLLSQGADEEHGRDRTIVTWYLDGEGKAINTTAPFAVESLADKALDAIKQDLSEHDLSKETTADLRQSFLDALKIADTKNRQRSLSSFSGSFPSHFQSIPGFISHDGSRILYTSHNDSTQSGMRPPDSLPQIIVCSLNTNDTPIATLKCHTDAIMWVAFSPTNPTIVASAAWDGTYRIWDTSLRDESMLKHLIKIEKLPQNWSGAFSPDGEYVLLSGTDNVALYSVSTGEKLHDLSSQYKLASWVRYLSYSTTDNNAISLISGTEILLWEPFSENKVTPIVTVEKDEGNRFLDLFMEFRVTRWLDGGRLLAAKAAEGSWLVWDRKRNLKWRFQRTKKDEDAERDLWVDACAVVKEEDGKEIFVSLDGDRKVREWVLE